jgi:DNA-binding GntR family transcriptional regulator
MARASETAYEVLRAEILSWELVPGTVLAEVELSGRLGISRTPVREALARLVADGLVEPLGGRGLVVTPVSAENVAELFELRQALEAQAAALAAERREVAVFRALQAEFREVPDLLADPDPGRHAYYDLVSRFDDAVDAAVQNPFLVSALNAVRTHLVRIRRLSHDNPGRLLEAAREHLLIVDAIVDGDARLAADATRVHLYRSLESTRGSLVAHGAEHPLSPANTRNPTNTAAFARNAAPAITEKDATTR